MAVKAKDFFLTLIGLAMKKRQLGPPRKRESKVYPHSSTRQLQRAQRQAAKRGSDG